MLLAVDCLLTPATISVEEALSLRDSENSILAQMADRFVCKECGERVRPFKASTNIAAHFEHSIRNPTCSLSDPPRP